MTADRSEPRASGEAWASQDLASAWQSGAAARGEAMSAVTELLLDLAGVTAGSRVLDVGAGTGDQTLVAAQRVWPGGSVLATDPAATMLGLAVEAFRGAGLQNVETRVMATENLDLEPGSFDAVIARNSLQFVPDLQRGLAEVRRVLKPGGRFASLSWSATENNPFRAIPHAVASRAAGRPFPEPGPGPWALRDAAALAEAFQAAGFQDVDVRAAPIAWRFPSLDDAVRNLEETFPPIIRLLGTFGEGERAATRAEIRQALQPYAGPDGFEAPGEVLIASGAA